MGNLFVVYGDILSKKLLFLADVIAMPAYNGNMYPQDELTQRFFELAGMKRLETAIYEKYGNEHMEQGDVRKLSGFDLIETVLFVNCADKPLWNLDQSPEVENRLIIGYHNITTIAMLMGYKSILLPNFGASLSDEENQRMIRRIKQVLLRELRRRNMDFYLVLPEYLV